MLQEIFRRGGGKVFVSCVVHVLLKFVFTVHLNSSKLDRKLNHPKIIQIKIPPLIEFIFTG
jgi:hypothetical protein